MKLAYFFSKGNKMQAVAIKFELTTVARIFNILDDISLENKDITNSVMQIFETVINNCVVNNKEEKVVYKKFGFTIELFSGEKVFFFFVFDEGSDYLSTAKSYFKNKEFTGNISDGKYNFVRQRLSPTVVRQLGYIFMDDDNEMQTMYSFN